MAGRTRSRSGEAQRFRAGSIFSTGTDPRGLLGSKLQVIANALDGTDRTTVALNADIRGIIDSNIRSAKFDRRIAVDFRTDPQTQHNAIRELIMNFAFDEAPTAKSAALDLAVALSAGG